MTLFPDRLRVVTMAIIFGVKTGEFAKSDDSPLFDTFAFLNGVEYRNSDVKRFIGDGLATLF